MKRHTDLLPDRVLELQKELIDDLELNSFILHDKSMRCPGIKAKWLQILIEEQTFLKKLEDSVEKLVDKYVVEHGKMGIPKFKSEIEARKSDDIKKLQIAIKKQKEVTRYMEQVYKIVSSFNFEIKNAIDLIKMEQ